MRGFHQTIGAKRMHEIGHGTRDEFAETQARLIYGDPSEAGRKTEEVTSPHGRNTYLTLLSPSSVFPSNRDVKPGSTAQAASAATHTIVIKIRFIVPSSLPFTAPDFIH